LEKYFNKSAVVNVANSSANNVSNEVDNNLGPNLNTSPNVSNVYKPRAKQTLNDSNRSISMSLRKTRRPDYKQLSNGDFNSDEEISETEIQSNQFTSTTGRKQNIKQKQRYSGQLTRQIKTEIINGTYTHRPHTNVENSEDDNSDINEDNRSEVFETDMAHNDSSDDQNMDTNDDNRQKASTSKGGLKKATYGRPVTTKMHYSFMNASDSNVRQPKATNSRPIKGDPDKVSLIHCALCPRVFSQSSSLSIHMRRIHSEDKEHICQLCGKKYSWRSGLYKHMKSHRTGVSLDNH